MASTPISFDLDEVEHALTTLQRWIGGDGLPAKGTLAKHDGTSVGVTSTFHGHLAATAGTFEDLATEIRASLAKLHDALAATVADLSNTDELAAAAADGMLARLVTPAFSTGTALATTPPPAITSVPEENAIQNANGSGMV